MDLLTDFGTHHGTEWGAGPSYLEIGQSTRNIGINDDSENVMVENQNEFVMRDNNDDDDIDYDIDHDDDVDDDDDDDDYDEYVDDDEHTDDDNDAEGFQTWNNITHPNNPELHDSTEHSWYPSTEFLQQVTKEYDQDTYDMPRCGLTYGEDGALLNGMVFADKGHVKTAVKDHSIRIARREYQVVESTSKIWKVVCKHGAPTCV